MSIKTLAVCLTTTGEADWLLPLCSDLARDRGAHLVGVHPSEPVVPYVAATSGIGAMAVPQFMDWQVEETAAIGARFQEITKGDDFVAEWREQGAAELGAEDFLLDSVRAADLVVMGQPEADMPRADHRRYFDALVRYAGRPLLLVPRDTQIKTLGAHAMLGWSGTREATRAAHDLRVLARAGAMIDIAFIQRGSARGRDDTSREDLAASFARHGFQSRVTEVTKGAEDTGEQLMRMAREAGADMLAVGAYGHSLVYDLVVGAVTRQLYEAPALPILFSR
jgi:nucleotide-binding universal stress UspA family protein